MTTYVEYSVSAGHGTLVEHGVEVLEPHQEFYMVNGKADFIAESITSERYSEFISIHGGERAV